MRLEKTKVPCIDLICPCKLSHAPLLSFGLGLPGAETNDSCILSKDACHDVRAPCVCATDISFLS